MSHGTKFFMVRIDGTSWVCPYQSAMGQGFCPMGKMCTIEAPWDKAVLDGTNPHFAGWDKFSLLSHGPFFEIVP